MNTENTIEQKSIHKKRYFVIGSILFLLNCLIAFQYFDSVTSQQNLFPWYVFGIPFATFLASVVLNVLFLTGFEKDAEYGLRLNAMRVISFAEMVLQIAPCAYFLFASICVFVV